MTIETRTASTLLAGLLVFALGWPGAALGAEPDEPEAEASAEEKSEIKMSPEARLLGEGEEPEPVPEGWFRPGPQYDEDTYDIDDNLRIYGYGGKYLNRTAELPVELGRRLYDRGVYAPRPTYLGRENPVGFAFMAYGDLRTAVAYNDDGEPGRTNRKTHQSTIATRLNLDLDFQFTATERIHAFLRPFDDNGSFLRYDIDGKVKDEFVDEFDLKLETLFFEGELGAIRSGRRDMINNIDLPFAIGFLPVVTQNGVWIEDAFQGFAFAITAKNSAKFDISNYDITFFAGFNEVDTAAVAGPSDASIFGVATFADLKKGYLEAGYAYVLADDSELSYHNVTAAFSRRFGDTLSNSVRVIGNLGQDGLPSGGPDRPGARRRVKTADGVLLLIENSLITNKPLTLVPYFNFFAGWDRPQSLARAGDAGGVLRNTGINFETDGLTGFPTLDARGHDAYGGAIGVEYLWNLDRQLVVEVSGLDRHGDVEAGSEYALGVRFQQPLNNAWILRFDAMAGWRDKPANDISGIRLEIRRKF